MFFHPRSRTVVFLATVLLVSGAFLYLCIIRQEKPGCEVTVYADFEILCKVCRLYKMDTGVYPEKIEDLYVNSGDRKGWRGPYLLTPARDPWGGEYMMFSNKWGLWIGTFGADHSPAGEHKYRDYFVNVTTRRVAIFEWEK